MQIMHYLNVCMNYVSLQCQQLTEHDELNLHHLKTVYFQQLRWNFKSDFELIQVYSLTHDHFNV